MKKIFKILLLTVMSAVCLLSFTGCSSAINYDEAPAPQDFSSADMRNELREFIEVNDGNRASLSTDKENNSSDGELVAADYLAEKLTALVGGTARDKIKSFTSTITSTASTWQTVIYTYNSQNVQTRISAPTANNPDRNHIVLCANYDNYYDDTSASGAFSNGTGVASVLSLADYIYSHKSDLTVDVDIAFFGMGTINNAGATEYYNGYSDNLILAVNFDSIGADNLYAYFDETPTGHGQFIMNVADELGYSKYVSEPSVWETSVGGSVSDSLPYSPYQIINDSRAFVGKTNLCSFTSGAKSGITLSHQESEKNSNIADTEDDTFAMLEEIYPEYSKQMAIAAQIVTSSIFAEGFAEACVTSAQNTYNYKWLTSPLVTYIVLAVTVAVLLICAIILIKVLEKKYPYVPPKPKKVKMAVFGMDYEDPKENDVFVDIKTPQDLNPFDDFDNDGKNNNNKQ